MKTLGINIKENTKINNTLTTHSPPVTRKITLKMNKINEDLIFLDQSLISNYGKR